HIHNYNGQCDHNEMFHNFSYKGFMSRVWMATARTGHSWGGVGWDVNKYLFGAADLFDDCDFGADCTLHNENLSNEQVFRKGSSMFQKVIEYAHRRGVKIGLGLDIDLIPLEYHADANNPEIINARVDQIVNDYPDLDYLICFQSETGVGNNPQKFYQNWRNIFMGFYNGIKARSPNTKLAVAGWGLDPNSINTLPADVICSPISAYSDTFENGQLYGDREYWGCPWLERDFRSSEYYYPYNMHLANTITSYQQRTTNMKGFYCLTWRLADAIDPKMWYIANAPWDNAGKYSSSRAVYYDYALKNYGPDAADDITKIIDQNEPYADDSGECSYTPEFTGATRPARGLLFNISRFKLYSEGLAEPLPVQVTNYSQQQGIINAPCNEGGQCVGYIENSDWVKYDNIDFGEGSNVFCVRASSETSGGDIELRLDELNGPLIGICKIENTGGWQNWSDFKSRITNTVGKHSLYMRFLAQEVNDLPKANIQLAIIDKHIADCPDPAQRQRLELLRCRIASAKNFIELQHIFPTIKWQQMPGAFADWVENFTHRVIDISSLGNVQSIQNRFVQLRYIEKEQNLRKQQNVSAPSCVKAKGTINGAVITWQNEQYPVLAFNIYRDGTKLNKEPLKKYVSTFSDTADGVFGYTVTAIDNDQKESPPSVPAVCAAGNYDKQSPFIVVISPPTSGPQGQPVDIKARILDGRTQQCIGAELFYRNLAQKDWKKIEMTRRTKAVFTGRIPAEEISDTAIEYYIIASDGNNISYFPASAPQMPLTFITYRIDDTTPPAAPKNVKKVNQSLSWQPAGGDVFWYKIYRSGKKDFAADMSTLLTYVHKDTTSFTDNSLDFNGYKMNGGWYYKITAVDKAENESEPTDQAEICW
ncbi:MAG: carbohydrate-binding protein, partial [Planctomycetota bacterium]|nr:carbohydrate-binding protein [Planctomycetota bacterium]